MSFITIFYEFIKCETFPRFVYFSYRFFMASRCTHKQHNFFFLCPCHKIFFCFHFCEKRFHLEYEKKKKKTFSMHINRIQMLGAVDDAFNFLLYAILQSINWIFFYYKFLMIWETSTRHKSSSCTFKLLRKWFPIFAVFFSFIQLNVLSCIVLGALKGIDFHKYEPTYGICCRRQRALLARTKRAMQFETHVVVVFIWIIQKVVGIKEKFTIIKPQLLQKWMLLGG